MKRYPMIAVLSYCALTSAAFAAEEHRLKDITVKGEAVSEEQQPVTINSIDSEKIEKLYIQRPEEILKEVPGVEVGNYNQGGVANTINMRGFTSGAHGGDVALFIDGVTLNESEGHADGYADMNVLIPLEIDHADVYKGPSSALYGNFARGGIISFSTKKGGEYNQLRMEYGSDNTFNTQGAFGIKLSENIHNNTAVQYFHTDGYHENSNWLRGNFSTRFSFKPSDNIEMAASARAHGSEWEGPGYIPEEQFKNGDASAQGPFAEDDGGAKRFYTERFDIGVSFTEQLKLLGWLYGTQQDFTRYAKFNYSLGGQTERNYDRSGIGTGASINYSSSVGAFPINAVAGVEYYNENSDMVRYHTTNRVRDSLKEKRSYSIGTLSEFAQVDMEFTQYFRPLLGFRVDHFFGENDDKMKNVTSDINDYLGLSPKAGFSSRIIDPLDFRFSYSRGYKLPNAQSKYDPDWALDPVVIRQLETGFNFKHSTWISADLAGYILDTENEMQKDPDDDKYKNMGKTRRLGLEFGTELTPFKGFELTGHVGGFTSEILESEDIVVKDNDGNETERYNLTGKQITGAPKYVGAVGARYEMPFGLGIGLNYRQVGSYAVDKKNTTYYEGYNLLDSDIFYTINGENGNKYRLYFSVKNIADNHYAQSVWGSMQAGLNYAVGSPRTFTGGMQIDW